MADIEALLVLHRLCVQNANAISSALTWGFPSPSAFTGFVHALHRRLTDELQLTFDGVAIVSHEFGPQASRPSGKHHHTFHLSRHPITREGKTAAIVEEGRAHLSLSLVIGVAGAGLYAGAELSALAQAILAVATEMRLAGGSIMEERPGSCEMHLMPGTVEEKRRLTRSIGRRLLPGFALVSRESALEEHWRCMQKERPSTSMLDALLDLSALKIEPPEASESRTLQDSDEKIDPKRRLEWQVHRRKGWLVPIPAGYHALTQAFPPGEVRNARDRTIPFRFVEGLYTMGEWINPLRLDDICQALWFHVVDENAGVYRWTTPHFARQNDMEGI